MTRFQSFKLSHHIQYYIQTDGQDLFYFVVKISSDLGVEVEVPLLTFLEIYFLAVNCDNETNFVRKSQNDILQ